MLQNMIEKLAVKILLGVLLFFKCQFELVRRDSFFVVDFFFFYLLYCTEDVSIILLEAPYASQAT